MITCSSSIAFDFQVSFPDGSIAIAYEAALESAMKSVRGMRARTFGRGIRDFPAYGSIEIRPMIQAFARNVLAVSSYAAVILCTEPIPVILPSTDSAMWQMT